jgi:hypothetical protein
MKIGDVVGFDIYDDHVSLILGSSALKFVTGTPPPPLCEVREGGGWPWLRSVGVYFAFAPFCPRDEKGEQKPEQLCMAGFCVVCCMFFVV